MERKEPQKIALAISHCSHLPGYAKTIDPLPRWSGSRQDRLPTQPSIAMESIRANKGRAALTILGVGLGVFVVVALSSVVHGINESFRAQLIVSQNDIRGPSRLPLSDPCRSRTGIGPTGYSTRR